MTRILILLFSICALTVGLLEAQEKPDVNIVKQMCPANDCRKDITVRLKKEDGSLYERKFDVFPPVIQGQFFTLLPGENINLEVQFENNRAVSLRSVAKVTNSKKTLNAHFEQTGDGANAQMLLTISNPFPKTLKYHLKMMTLDEKLLPSSSCPIGPGMTNYESWSHPIFQLVIGGIQLVSEKSGPCEY